MDMKGYEELTEDEMYFLAEFYKVFPLGVYSMNLAGSIISNYTSLPIETVYDLRDKRCFISDECEESFTTYNTKHPQVEEIIQAMGVL